MFKKLKDKIVEEAKNSPQRFQQITQSVSDKLQSSTAEDNFFSIDDEADSRPSISSTPTPTSDGGFTSVTLHSSTPIEPRQRRTSNSSMASDVSFLPRYEPGNMYHLQSDIEASASEMEDNVSTSSTQMGHITKEQVYAELQRVRLRYHKYRGRYTDLANHYKDMERENAKMKSVLVETQDVSIRRVGELREQCQLEQKAKAHLENALRVEIDEKQYIIDTLKTKIELLNTSNTSVTVFTAENDNGAMANGNLNSPSSPEYMQLSTDLTNAKSEIIALNEKLQELKASKIISQTKEANLLLRINELEAEMTKNATNNNNKLAKLTELEGKIAKMAELEAKLVKMAELEAKVVNMAEMEAKLANMSILEEKIRSLPNLEDKQKEMADLKAKVSKMAEQEARIAQLIQAKDKIEADYLEHKRTEEENNVQMARDKMSVHTELQNKDLEISNLKTDLDTLRDELETYEKETAPKNAANCTKMDNLQSQNTKLIDKVESLIAKCNNMEVDLLKMEQLRQENKHLSETANNLKEVNKGFSKELSTLNKLKDNLSDTIEALEVARNDTLLLSGEKTNLQQELESVIKSNASLNERFSNLNMEHNDLDGKYNKLLIDNTSLSDSLIGKNEELEKIRSDAKSSLLTLEAKITKKLQRKFDQRLEKMLKDYEDKVNKLAVNDENVKQVQVKLLAREDSIKILEEDLRKINEELAISRKKYNELETNYLELIEENRQNAAEKQKVLSEKILIDKTLENNYNVIEQVKEQLKSKFLEVTSLKERLDSSKSSKSTLEERIKDLEQVLQDKDYHIAESTSKINNELKEYKTTVDTLEASIKLKNDEIEQSRIKLSDLTERVNAKIDSTKNEYDERLKMLEDEIVTAKTNSEFLNNSLVQKNNEISELQTKIVTRESELVKMKKLIERMERLSKENGKLTQEKLDATQQVEKLREEKLFGQKQLTSIISEIKLEFENVQAESNNYKKQLEELDGVKLNFDELQSKQNDLQAENLQLSSKIDEISQEKTSIREELSALRSSVSDSSKQSSNDLLRLNADKLDLVKEVNDLNKIVDNLTSDQQRYKQQIIDLEMSREEMDQAVEERDKCLQEISDLKGNLQRLVNDRQHLEQQAAHLHDIQRQHSIVTTELTSERAKTSRLTDELSLVTVRSRQLAEDRDRLVEESERMVMELEQTKLMLEEGQKGSKAADDAQLHITHLTSELNTAQVQIASLTSQIESQALDHFQVVATTQLSNQLSHNHDESEFTLQRKLSEMTKKFETILEENRVAKEELARIGRVKEEVEGKRRRLELMVGDMDRSYSEMKHENQLLKDEIQELKISPININSSSKSANLNSNLPNGNNNITTALENSDLTKEIEQLREKVQQYKVIDTTNRSSIEFFELELDRARARGDKFERKLDETLVTLRHCAELSGVDTQVEYLRHVLYNYMLGREGVVLARVIAAVCKFDPVQTEAVIKHEQQKQSLLGQLGIL